MLRSDAARVSKALGISVEALREGLRSGKFPFGTAFKLTDTGRWIYVLYPGKLEEYIGEENDIEPEDEDDSKWIV